MDLRCFIAIEFPEELKKSIDVYTERLRATNADVKWVPSKNLHLTLKFLGKTREDLLPEINRTLQSVAKMRRRFCLSLHGSGVFPNLKNPHVIWLGIQDSEEMARLQKDIEESMAALGFQREDRGFSPHLTVGRMKSLKNMGLLIKELATLKETDFGKIEVINIALMKSELKPGGAEHFKLSEIPIGKER